MTDNPKGATPAERWAGDENIESPFNACMHRGYCLSLKHATPPAAAEMPLTERQFAEWLNDRRMHDVSSVFHDIVLHYRAALAAASEIVPLTDEREAFEAWLRESRYDAGELQPGIYHSPFTRNAWIAWQARAALATQAAPKDSKDLGVSPPGAGLFAPASFVGVRCDP